MAARSALESGFCTGSPVGRAHLLSRIEYLEGRYPQAGDLLELVRTRSMVRPLRRQRATRMLSLTHFQTNDYEKAASLPLHDPLTTLMRAFPGAPNLIAWNTGRRVEIPFLQASQWELPRVEVTVNGTRTVAVIDTGGDLFSIPRSAGAQFGIVPVASATGWFAGGSRARVGWGRADRLDLGDVVLHNVPVSINTLPHAAIGTGLLRQFLTTIDYPAAKLILRPRGVEQHNRGTSVPFLMAQTHLLIAPGHLDGKAGMQFLVDSGLELDNGGAFLAPDATLASIGLSLPTRYRRSGRSGAGEIQLDIGEFSIRSLALGSVVRHDLVGVTGIFPPQLAKPGVAGFPLHGLVSHNFLRRYRWTIDFDLMAMRLEAPAAGS